MSERRKFGFNRLAMLVSLALPIVLISLSFSYRSFQQYRADSTQVRQTRAIITHADALLLDLRRAESAQRGYLLTGQPDYLNLYQQSSRRIMRDLSDLKSLVAGNDRQQDRIKAIGELCTQKLNETATTIDDYNQGRREEAMALMRTARGDQIMTNLSGAVLAMENEEQTALVIRRDHAQSQARNTFVVSCVGFLVLLIFLAFAGLFLDKDNQRRTKDQQAIRALNEQLTRELKARSDILESIQDGFCAFDASGRATYVNPAAEGLLGSSLSRLAGRSVEDIFHLDHSAELVAHLHSLREHRTVLNHEQYFEPYQKWFQLHFFPAAGGGFTLYFTNITGQKKAEEERARLLSAVQESRALLDTFFDKAPLGLGCWDSNLRFIRVNPALAEMNGVAPEEHIGRSVSEVVPQISDQVLKVFWRVIAGESITGLEITGMTAAKPDKLRTWIASYYPIRLSDEVILIGGIMEEVTERKAIEESLRQAAKLESLGVLAGGIAHDFNNLLTGILGNASLAIDSLSPNNPARNILADVISASERAAHLTRQMLAYAGRGRFVMQLVDLSDLVREIGSLVRMSIPHNVQLRFELQERLPCVIADISQLEQLVMNLVINAAEAIPTGEHGSVLVTTGSHDIDEGYIRQTFSGNEITPGRYVYLEVHDTGIGMDQATIARIFDPFFTTKFTGRGLGLAAVLGIVRGHKGGLKVYSTPGKGTAFKVLFPSTDEAPPKQDVAHKDVSPLGSATVLVIDDEDIIRRTTKAALERFGYSVILGENGREGVELLRVLTDKISLVILDLTMPVMSGEEALREIRAIRPELKIILSSGFNESEALQRFHGKNLSGFLQKPYTARKLAEIVRETLSGAENAVERG